LVMPEGTLAPGRWTQGTSAGGSSALLGGSVLLLTLAVGALLGGADVAEVGLVEFAATTHLQRQHVRGLSPLSLPGGMSVSRLHVRTQRARLQQHQLQRARCLHLFNLISCAIDSEGGKRHLQHRFADELHCRTVSCKSACTWQAASRLQAHLAETETASKTNRKAVATERLTLCMMADRTARVQTLRGRAGRTDLA
jgi:hypothetical protein